MNKSLIRLTKTNKRQHLPNYTTFRVVYIVYLIKDHPLNVTNQIGSTVKHPATCKCEYRAQETNWWMGTLHIHNSRSEDFGSHNEAGRVVNVELHVSRDESDVFGTEFAAKVPEFLVREGLDG